MSLSMFQSSVPAFIKQLRQLDRWLDKAVAHAQASGFDPNTLLTVSLAPDQYPLVRQVQAACDAAKAPAARLSGTPIPSHPDTEQTVDELKARIATCLRFLESLDPGAFTGAEQRPIPLPGIAGKVSDGADYLIEFALPNFYFHVTTAYAILRHKGVQLGKRDFIGPVTLRDG